MTLSLPVDLQNKKNFAVPPKMSKLIVYFLNYGSHRKNTRIHFCCPSFSPPEPLLQIFSQTHINKVRRFEKHFSTWSNFSRNLIDPHFANFVMLPKVKIASRGLNMAPTKKTQESKKVLLIIWDGNLPRYSEKIG